MNKTCFFLAPVGPEGAEVNKRSELLFRYFVAPLAADAGYTAVRVDPDAPGATHITADVLERVLNAGMVVADVSGRHPNVLYQLGVRHTAGKPVILLLARGERTPFDAAEVRTITYDFTDEAVMDAVRADLAHALSDAGVESASANPVGEAVDLTALREARQQDLASGHLATILRVLTTIDSRLSAIEARPQSTRGDDSGTRPTTSKRIFVVHGHDSALKTELARMLERLGLAPVILHEQPRRGEPLLNRLQAEVRDVGFAFVLLTPDDVGSVAARTKKWKPRARQNVIFEHGLLTALLGHERVCAIVQGDVEIPSDLHGVLFQRVPAGGSLASIALELVNELKAAGYLVDANRLTA
jgi:predicted nucleotide-binding protein